MATTDILQWDPTGTNIEDQAAYAADAVRLTGYTAGLARSDITNKAVRQATFMAAGLAGFIVNQGISVPDDGNLGNLITEITNAIASYVDVISGAYAVDTGIVNASVVALVPPLAAYVDGMELRVKIKVTNTGDTTLDAGPGPRQILREDLQPLNAGDWPATFIGTVNYSATLNKFELAYVAPSQHKETVTPIAVNTGAHLANSGTLFVCTSNPTITVDASSTLFNGWFVDVLALGAGATIAINGADSINGGTAGVGFSVLLNQSLRLKTDGAGHFYTEFVTTPSGAFYPLLINANATVGPGTYNVDTSAGAVTITIGTGSLAGNAYQFNDIAGTFDVNPLTINGGGLTFAGTAAISYICDTAGRALMLENSNGSNLRMF